MDLSEVTVIVPTYNEEENIGRLLKELIDMGVGEIVVVDDNSRDRTRDIVRGFVERYGDHVKLLERPGKMGLGSAYKDGFRLATGEVIVEMDADLSHRPQDLPRVVEGVERGDVSVGSRYIAGGRVVGWPLHRRVVSWGANLLARIVLGVGVKDATSGFRAYRREVFAEIAEKSCLNNFNFQVEALYIARKAGWRIVEVPITFVERVGGKSKMGVREILSFLIGVIKLRLGRC